MKYTVKRKCGHEERIALFGSYNSRQKQLEWEASKLCKACYIEEKKQAEKTDAESLGLPELTGSEKQIAWANSIRLEWAKPFLAKLDSWRERGADEADIERCRQAFLAVLSNRTEAKWWIDHQHELDLKLRPELEKVLTADA